TASPRPPARRTWTSPGTATTATRWPWSACSPITAGPRSSSSAWSSARAPCSSVAGRSTARLPRSCRRCSSNPPPTDRGQLLPRVVPSPLGGAFPRRYNLFMKRTVDALRDDTFDLLILGGGITGAGVALDAALRGLRVGLIDKGVFASGTSSVSSKLVHGGLRYLEHGNFSLVYEALHERRRLLENAPHLVRPLRFVVPFYQGT